MQNKNNDIANKIRLFYKGCGIILALVAFAFLFSFTPSAKAAVSLSCSVASSCLSAHSLDAGSGQAQVSMNWVISPECANGLPIIQNVTRYRQVGSDWSMSNYVSHGPGVTSYTFPITFAPGNYEFSIKTNPNSSQSVFLQFPCGSPDQPTVTLTADNTNVDYNGNTTLHWSSNNATSCSASGGTNGWAGAKSLSGSFNTGALTSTTTYNITCSNSVGSANSSVTVSVGNQIPNPTVNLTADSTFVDYNGNTNLHWTSTNATSCNASGGVNGWSGAKSLSGSFNTGALTGTTTYNITCSNSVGSANSSVTVSVGNQIQNPTVNLTAVNTNINYNDNTTLNWSSTNATSCSASGGTNGWAGAKSLSGSFNTGALTSTTTYNITCSNSVGSANSSVTVSVNNQNNNQVSVSISADSTNISYNSSTTIRWYPNNATSCYGSGGTNGWSGTRSPFSDSFYTGTLFYTTTYTIYCTNYNGNSNSASVTVNVGNQQIYNYNQPYVTTNNATNVTTYSATLNGTVNGNGSYATAWFQYGTDVNLGYSTPQNSYSSWSSFYSAPVSGLVPNTIYYFRAMAQGSQGIIYGNVLSFNTSPGFIYTNNNQPTVVVSADASSVPYNGATFIRWYTTNATSCFASGGSVGWAGTKAIGPGSFYTGSLTVDRTYSMTCSNSYGSGSDSATVIVRNQTVTTRPIPTSLVLITSSVDRNQPIVPTIDNTRPHPGDEINYTVSYQNVGNGSVTALTLQIILPGEVDFLSSNPSNSTIYGNTLTFNLGTLKANGQGSVAVRVRVRDNTPLGTNLNFPATLSYVDPSGTPQSVSANVSAQVWDGATVENNSGSSSLLGANVFGAGFLPTNLFGWLLLLIFILILILLVRHLTEQSSGQKTITTTAEH